MAKNYTDATSLIPEIRELAKQGFSMKKVAEMLNLISRNAVAGVAWREGIKFSPKTGAKKETSSPKKTRAREKSTAPGKKNPAEQRRTPLKKERPELLIVPPQVVALEKCIFPVGEKDGHNYPRCGKPAVKKEPCYCEEHLEKAYKPSSEKARGIFRLSQHYNK